MSLAGQLYRLQQLDLELHRKQQELNEVQNQLSDDKAMLVAESRVSKQKEQLEEAKKRQKSSEWEIEDLREKVKQINGKLYSGKTKDSKELVNLEKELTSIKGQIRAKEDALLGVMSQVEEMEAALDSMTGDLERLKQEWEQKQKTLVPRKSEIEAELGQLKEDRNLRVQEINAEAFTTYERIRLAMGQAVVKVERGRCLGCHIAVPTSQWQKARAGDLIQCNNCSRILYLE